MDVLKNALEVICDSVNVYLNNIDQRSDSWVVLTSIVDHDGSINQLTRGKIVMGVYNITREAFASSYTPVAPGSAGRDVARGMSVVAPPLYLDVHVIFMANFTERSYPDGLAALSRLIGFFQQNRVFTPQNSPDLAPELANLSLDIENLAPVEVNYVMSMLGTRYLPSVFYNLRMIPFASSAMLERRYPVQSVASSAGAA